MRPDHQKNVEQWLKKGRSLTSKMAFSMWSCTRLASCIQRLKRDKDMNIVTNMKYTNSGVGYAEYVYKK
jgi:hypothetical protein